MFIYASTFAAALLLTIVLIPVLTPNNQEARSGIVSYVFIGSYVSITISYSVIITLLILTLRKMSTFGDFSE